MITRQGDPRSVRQLVRCIRGGGVAVSPCDTIYGIVGKAPETEHRIRTLKGRGEAKPFIVLEPTVDEVTRAAVEGIPDSLLALWPGPLTLIVRTKDGTTGYRVPSDPWLNGVLRQTGPVYSTSVNFSGGPSLWRIADIVARFESLVDLIVDGGNLQNRIPSTILDISVSPYKLLRKGALPLPEEVFRLCE